MNKQPRKYKRNDKRKGWQHRLADKLFARTGLTADGVRENLAKLAARNQPDLVGDLL